MLGGSYIVTRVRIFIRSVIQQDLRGLSERDWKKKAYITDRVRLVYVGPQLDCQVHKVNLFHSSTFRFFDG